METAKQVERVLDYMRGVGGITQIEALRELGVMRLASRIADLRKQGFDIVGKTIPVVNRYGEVCHVKCYSLRGVTDHEGAVTR